MDLYGSKITILIFIILKYKLLILIPFVGSLAGIFIFLIGTHQKYLWVIQEVCLLA